MPQPSGSVRDRSFRLSASTFRYRNLLMLFDGCRLRPALDLVRHAARLDPSNAGSTDGCAGTAQREYNNADHGFQLSTSTGTYLCPSYLSA